MGRARFPFRLKLTLLFAALTIGPLLAVGWLLIDVNESAVATSSRELQIALANDVSRTVEQEVRGAAAGLGAVARALVDTSVDETGRLELAAALLESDDRLDVVAVHDQRGTLIDVLREPPAREVPMPDPLEPALRREAREQEMAVGEVSPGPGAPRLLLVTPVRDAEGTVTGYVSSRVSTAPVQARVERLADAHLATTAGTVFVVDGRRRVVAHPDVERARSLAPAEATELLAAAEGGASSTNVARSAETEQDGVEMVGTVVPVGGLPWSVVVQVPRSAAYASLERMRSIVIATLVVSVLVALLVAVLVARRITAPLSKLASFARDLADRRFDRRVTLETRDELSDLADAMSRAAADLESSESRIRREAAIRSDLGRYLSAELVDKVVRREQDMELGGRRLEVSVLFADVVAFTPLTERLPPEEVVSLLNELFTVLTEVVFRHGGTVDKFVGDSIMAVWGAPTPQADHATRALLAAEDMLRWLETVNPGWQDRWGVGVQLAIGVNSGEAVVGNVGSERRMEYTAIGDVVNVAARLEAIARPNQILVSGATRAAAGDGFEYARVGGKELSGRAEPVDLWEVRP